MPPIIQQSDVAPGSSLVADGMEPPAIPVRELERHAAAAGYVLVLEEELAELRRRAYDAAGARLALRTAVVLAGKRSQPKG